MKVYMGLTLSESCVQDYFAMPLEEFCEQEDFAASENGKSVLYVPSAVEMGGYGMSAMLTRFQLLAEKMKTSVEHLVIPSKKPWWGKFLSESPEIGEGKEINVSNDELTITILTDKSFHTDLEKIVGDCEKFEEVMVGIIKKDEKKV